MTGQALLPKSRWKFDFWVRCIIFAVRVFVYLTTMLRLLATSMRDIVQAYRRRDLTWFRGIGVPTFLLDAYQAGTMFLGILLLIMCAFEPYFYCASSPDFPTEECPESADTIWMYSMWTMWAMLTHWLLMMELSVF